MARDEMVSIPVQVNGRLRHLIEVAADAGEAEVREISLAHPKIREHIGGRQIAKLIYVPGKILNIVTR